jgi:hypothetical protein
MAGTAVEWYVEQEIELTLDFISKKINDFEYGIKKLRLIEKAKEMEKQQIMKSVYDSMGTNFDPNMGRAELYYNETFKSE